ncbi:MAG: helix-turn-helix domain-containing protein [Chloroflexota bacterium]|nr:helix-turn-helix domain-containing protein [Chloroflexota bacterium]
MAKTRSSPTQAWLTLHDASKQLGVSPATLRQWADKGKVRVFRTPGGHRRFSQVDMRALTFDRGAPQSTRDLDRLIHSALGRARLEIAGGRLDREAWYRNFDDQAKQRHRELGHRLMTLLIQALREEPGEQNLPRSARSLGKEYGRTSLRQGTSLPDALRAFLYFRDYIFEDLIDLSSRAESETGFHPLDVYRRLTAIVNEMLVSMVETYYGDIIRA